MIISWNVRGCNNIAKVREINFRLSDLQVAVAILVETRVKEGKSMSIRKKLGQRWCYLDNYTHHPNGRIWILWDPTQVDIRLVTGNAQFRLVTGNAQFLHCELFDKSGVRMIWLTAIYALNHLEDRRLLWNDVQRLEPHIQGNWLLMGDFNNVLTAQDRIGGSLVQPGEYCDLASMMDTAGLSELDSIGEHFTWHNRHTQDPIYSRIDRVIGNMC